MPFHFCLLCCGFVSILVWNAWTGWRKQNRSLQQFLSSCSPAEALCNRGVSVTGSLSPPGRLRELMLRLSFSIILTIDLSWPGKFSICQTTCLFVWVLPACLWVQPHPYLVYTEFRRGRSIPCTGVIDSFRGGTWALEVHPQSVPCENKYAKLLNHLFSPWITFL